MISLAHVDNRYMKTEKDYLIGKIKEFAHPGIQDSLINIAQEAGLKAPKPDFVKFAIKEPEDKIDMLFMAHELFWVDGHLDDREKYALDHILSEVRKDKEALLLLKQELEKLDRTKPDEKCLKAHIEEFFYG